jgi:hypothetical protein
MTVLMKKKKKIQTHKEIEGEKNDKTSIFQINND